MKIFLDIETLPTADNSVINEIKASIKPPATIKKPESIAEWYKTSGDEAAAAAVKATSFDALYGSIACICYAVEDEPVRSVDCLQGERIMLQTFYTRLTDEVARVKTISHVRPQFIGHNISGFDLPFLRQRSMLLDVPPPSFVLQAYQAKPYDTQIIGDTMLMWHSDRTKRVSLDKLCRAFGLQGKGDFNGSMVADTWYSDPHKVIEYCKQDVEMTRSLYNRMVFQ